MKQPPPFLYFVTIDDVDKGLRLVTKTYRPTNNGMPPKTMLDELTFWKTKPWVPAHKQTNVKTTVYRYNREADPIEVESPDPEPIDIRLPE